MAPRRSTTLSAAVGVLKKARRPLTVDEIWQRIEKGDAWSPPRGGKTPRATLKVQIARASMGYTGTRSSRTKLFRRLKDGMYELLT